MIINICYAFDRMRSEIQTHQHVLPAFVPARVTVEMLCEAWLYVGTFVLQQRTQRSLFWKVNNNLLYR